MKSGLFLLITFVVAIGIIVPGQVSGLQCYLCASIRASAIGTQNLSSPACNDTNFDPNLVPTQVPGNNISLLGTSLSASEFNCSACAVYRIPSFDFVARVCYTTFNLTAAFPSQEVESEFCQTDLCNGSPFVADENTSSAITPVTSSTTTTTSPSGSGSSSAPSRHSATLTLLTVFLGLASLLLLSLNY